jgi:peptide/nickel transport system substrate-binding protein
MPQFGHITRREAVIGLASVLGSSFLPARAAPKTLSIALTGDFPRLDPSKDTSPLGFNLRLNVFDALTQIERNGQVSPRLATKWAYSPDLTEWTFTLRDGVKFHDGSPLTAADVAWTIQRIQSDPTTPGRTFIRLVKTAAAVDPSTVKFTLVQPYAIFDRQITYINIMSKAYFDKVGDAGYGSQPVGTGPYKFVRWGKDDRTALQANPDYWRGEPAVKTPRSGRSRPRPRARPPCSRARSISSRRLRHLCCRSSAARPESRWALRPASG